MATATSGTDIDQLLGQRNLFINGKFVDADSGKTFGVINPATGEEICQVAEAGASDIDKAVKAARRAFDTGPWSKMDARDRGRLLTKLAHLIADNEETFCRLEVLDNGKPISETRAADLPLSIATFEYYGGWADKLEGTVIPVSGNFLNYTRREPVGVVGQIIPWNFPLMMIAWKVAPALCAGCTVVLKPAEQTPLSALKFSELCIEAGIPDGVVNIVNGFGETAGAALASHPEIDKIAFTGHYETGQLIMHAAADGLKRVSLELGGKAPNIIFDDADLPAAISGVRTGIFFNQGEVCCAGSRLFVQSGIHKEFIQEFANVANNIKLGDPMDESTEQGAQVSEEQFDKVLKYIDIGKNEDKADLVCGGERYGDRGYFVKPTIFDNVTNDMRIAQEEIFGPVIAAIDFKDVDEVIAAGNKTIYGLSAGIWTKDIAKAHKLAHGLRAGTIWINTFNSFDPASPFGGVKFSGMGSECGKQVLNNYTETKSIWVNLD